MADIILHHYMLSPYAEKTRLALGLKGLSYKSVDISPMTPRPLLTPMSGGYRRTPIMQIGADIYCDSLLILNVIDGMSSTGKLFPAGSKGLVKAATWWIEKSSFANAVCLAISNMAGKLPQELIDERAKLFPMSIEPKVLEPKRGAFAQRFTSQLHWLTDILSDGRKFICGDQPTAADLGAYHPLFFCVQNGGPEIEALLPMAKLRPWYDRVTAIGHGKPTPLSAEEAVQIAKDATPSDATDIGPDGVSIGLKAGDWVSVTPTDYGNPVCGKLLAFKDEEIIIRHEDPSVGRVNVHFPRADFDVEIAKK